MNKSSAQLASLARLRLYVAALAVMAIASQYSELGVARAGDRTQLVDMNVRLAAIASARSTRLPASSTSATTIAPASIAAMTAPSPTWPWRVPIVVLRLSRFEHVLHLSTNTVNANFWGVFDRGRGMYVRLSFHF
jgi:hypothetical protein